MDSLERRYNCSKNYLLNAVNDMLELQGAKQLRSNAQTGVAFFAVRMYRTWREYRLEVWPDEDGCGLRLTQLNGSDSTHWLQRILALLESLLQIEKTPHDMGNTES